MYRLLHIPTGHFVYKNNKKDEARFLTLYDIDMWFDRLCGRRVCWITPNIDFGIVYKYEFEIMEVKDV